MPEAKAGARRAVLISAVAAVLLLGLLIALIVVVARKDKDPTPPLPPTPVVKTDTETFIDVSDGLTLQWYSGAIAVKGDLTNLAGNNYNVANLPVRKSPTGVLVIRNTSIAVADSMETTKMSKLVLKLNMMSPSSDDVTTALNAFMISGNPNVIIVSLPYRSAGDRIEFLKAINAIKAHALYNRVILSIDLTSHCCQTGIGPGTLDVVSELHGLFDAPVMIEIDERSLAAFWDTLRPFVRQNEMMTMIITFVSGSGNDQAVLNGVLTARNDIEVSKLMYDLGAHDAAFRRLAVTAGSPIIYFNVSRRDAGSVVWSHNTDTWELLNAATSGNVMMIEGDIRFDNNTKVPIMAHDKGENNNLTFAQWLDEIIKVNKGMKFDFKELEAVVPALQIAASKRNHIKGPVWLNADLLQGPNAPAPPAFVRHMFLNVTELFPDATFSIGWTTVAKTKNTTLKYTQAMVQEMHEFCKNIDRPITFPVRAEQFRESLDEFHWLLSQSRAYTLTVWTAANDDVTKTDMEFMKGQFEISRVYFDLPENLRP